MKIIITEEKFNEISGAAEKMLHYGGRIMSMLEELEGGMGERNDDDDDDDDEMQMRGGYGQRGTGTGMGYRRGVRGTGPYSRYRYRR